MPSRRVFKERILREAQQQSSVSSLSLSTAFGALGTHSPLVAGDSLPVLTTGGIAKRTLASVLRTYVLGISGGTATIPENLTVQGDLTKTGTGTVTLNPTTAGALNNIVIGGTTPLAGTFTTLTAGSTLTQNGTTASLAQGTTSSQVLNVGSGTAAFLTDIRMNAAATQYARLMFRRNGVDRWALYLDNTAEPGADAGGQLTWAAHTDAGAFIDNVMRVTRAAAGTIAFSATRPITGGTYNGQTLSASASFTGSLAINGALSGVTTLATSGVNTLTNLAGVGSRMVVADASGVLSTTAIPSGTGDVVGPASSTDHAVARFDLTTGKLIQNSAMTIADSGAIVVSATDTSFFNGTMANVVSGLRVNQNVSTAVGPGFGSALGLFGTLTAGADFAKVIGIDLENNVWATGGFSGTEFYGIRIPSVSGGATNYSIYAGGGFFYSGGQGGFGALPSTTTRLIAAASTTGISSLRIPHGTAPSSPTNGDVWTTTAAMFTRINGATKTMATLQDTLDTFAAPAASVNFADQQALSFRIENRTSDPGSPSTGQIWLRTDL